MPASLAHSQNDDASVASNASRQGCQVADVSGDMEALAGSFYYLKFGHIMA